MNAVDMLVDFILAWISRNGPLPAPCPRDAVDCTNWWLSRMQEPERDGETHRTSADAGGEREVLDYAGRTRAALYGFLSLHSDGERETVARWVMNQNVPYRGDSFRFFADVVEETLKMRDSPEKYKQQALHMMNS